MRGMKWYIGAHLTNASLPCSSVGHHLHETSGLEKKTYKNEKIIVLNNIYQAFPQEQEEPAPSRNVCQSLTTGFTRLMSVYNQ